MPVIDNLVAYWELNEASGAAIDAHNDNDLTQNGTIGSSAGVVGNARDFESANAEFFNIVDNADLSMGNIAFSLAGWAKLTDKSSARVFISKTNGTNLEYEIRYNDGLDRLRFTVSSASNFTNVTSISADTLGSPATGTWYFIVARHDPVANTIDISVNGGAIDSGAYTFGTYDSSADLFLGRENTGSNLYLNGSLDEWGIWKRKLSASDISFLYNSGNGRSYADIVAEGSPAPDIPWLPRVDIARGPRFMAVPSGMVPPGDD